MMAAQTVVVPFLALNNSMPIFGERAYEIACLEWGIDSKTARAESRADGIVYQGPFGSTIFAGWDQLPIPAKP